MLAGAALVAALSGVHAWRNRSAISSVACAASLTSLLHGVLQRSTGTSQASVPGYDRTHQPWALQDPLAHQLCAL